MQKIFILIILLSIFNACTPRLKTHFLQPEDIQRPISFEKSQSVNTAPCYNPLAYAPDTAHLDHTPMKYVRVNFHWMNMRDHSKNYDGQEAIDYTHQLLQSINKDLANNQKMFLPRGNRTPVLPTQYRFVLTSNPKDVTDTGIYFHYDDKLSSYIHKGKNANLGNRDVIDKYAVRADLILNIFIMPHHPDSVKSKTYGAYGVGVCLGDVVKAAGMFENKGPAENYRGIFNHEIGHIFGLDHTWEYEDGCDDTPQHPNKCFAWSAESPCDTMAHNNLMDYNAYQHAWTPCQIGLVHYQMSNETALARRFLQPNWCELHDDRHITIRDTVHWQGAKDLEGHLTIASGGSLQISCRVSLPANAKITVQPGGTLILNNCKLHNACNKNWQGIEIQQLGKLKGQFIYIGEPKVENVKMEIPK